MPEYPWLLGQDLDMSLTAKKMEAMRTLGVPYSDKDIANAEADLQKQARAIYDELKELSVVKTISLENEIDFNQNKEIIALIAYLHKLGRDIGTNEEGGQQ